MLKRFGSFVCLCALFLQPAALVGAQNPTSPTQAGSPATAQTQTVPNEQDANILPEGTEMQLALREPVSSKLSEVGDEVLAVVRKNVVVDGRTVLREGTEIIGRVTLAQPAGRMLKGGQLHLTFERVRLDGGERRLSGVIKSASDFARDEKIKSDGEGTLKGGKDGGKVLQNVSTAVGLASVGATVILLASVLRNNSNGGLNGIGGGTVGAYAGVIGGSVVAALLFSKGKEVRLDQNAVIRLKLEKPLRIS